MAAMELSDYCNIYWDGSLLRARYDLIKVPECIPVQNEVLAFTVKDKVFIRPELTAEGLRIVYAMAANYEPHQLEFGADSICQALEKGWITPEEAVAQVFAMRARGGPEG